MKKEILQSYFKTKNQMENLYSSFEVEMNRSLRDLNISLIDRDFIRNYISINKKEDFGSVFNIHLNLQEKHYDFLAESNELPLNLFQKLLDIDIFEISLVEETIKPCFVKEAYINFLINQITFLNKLKDINDEEEKKILEKQSNFWTRLFLNNPESKIEYLQYERKLTNDIIDEIEKLLELIEKYYDILIDTFKDAFDVAFNIKLKRLG